ncbi:adenylate/guanylate cyclase domain-containing protein [Reyranella soli]|uniref:Adenylate cyclase n=1 Tax=Reyranella soli TaxID=1230389 RepID=A0A512NRJ5_9HYPH|nr:adenylate/guanylate cyclase domain-containing protein [Reyranella soli]GEP61571.1 adenylate cyclase [Reyranella soli]
MTEQRRLAAILVADVAGYSKLMGSDEAGTLAQLEALRKEIIGPQIAKHAGRLFKSVGDGFLIEFASAVQAVSCAKAIQEANGEGRLPLRIGIHVGDVVVQGDDLMGDGVNVAARVEGIADPGGIAITRAVHEQVRDKLVLGFTDKGEIELKNIQRPVQVFVIGGAKVAGQATVLPLPDKPSIAVLPFKNMSGNAEQQYFADRMVEDIITALSRIPSLFVIARNSSFAYKGKSIDIRHVGRELGVRYLMEGSVRKAGSRLRINGQLIEAETGVHLWADSFDSVLEEVFELQDRVTMAVAGAIEPSVTQAEIRRANRKPTENLQAYDWLLRARGEQQLFSRDGFDQAINMARRAIELDPRFAQAYGCLGSCISFRRTLGWMRDEEAETAEGVRLAHMAVQLAPNDPIVLTDAGVAVANLARDQATAIAWFDRLDDVERKSGVVILTSVEMTDQEKNVVVRQLLQLSGAPAALLDRR